jgi:hypothetical protein
MKRALTAFLSLFLCLGVAIAQQANRDGTQRDFASGVGAHDMTKAGLAWLSTWSASGAPVTPMDIKAGVIHTVAQIALPYPATSTSYKIVDGPTLSGAGYVFCYMAPASNQATKITKPVFSVTQAGVVSIKWTYAKDADPKLITRVQLSCQRK